MFNISGGAYLDTLYMGGFATYALAGLSVGHQPREARLFLEPMAVSLAPSIPPPLRLILKTGVKPRYTQYLQWSKPQPPTVFNTKDSAAGV